MLVLWSLYPGNNTIPSRGRQHAPPPTEERTTRGPRGPEDCRSAPRGATPDESFFSYVHGAKKWITSAAKCFFPTATDFFCRKLAGTCAAGEIDNRHARESCRNVGNLFLREARRFFFALQVCKLCSSPVASRFLQWGHDLLVCKGIFRWFKARWRTEVLDRTSDGTVCLVADIGISRLARGPVCRSHLQDMEGNSACPHSIPGRKSVRPPGCYRPMCGTRPVLVPGRLSRSPPAPNDPCRHGWRARPTDCSSTRHRPVDSWDTAAAGLPGRTGTLSGDVSGGAPVADPLGHFSGVAVMAVLPPQLRSTTRSGRGTVGSVIHGWWFPLATEPTQPLLAANGQLPRPRWGRRGRGRNWGSKRIELNGKHLPWHRSGEARRTTPEPAADRRSRQLRLFAKGRAHHGTCKITHFGSRS